jgi:hypothetical protein
MSKLADDFYGFLRTIFPYNVILKEHYVQYNHTKLFFDFYIKDLGILFEVQGRQHDVFVKHFHNDRETFLASKHRDNLKKEYCEKEDLILIEIRDEKELNKDALLKRILKKEGKLWLK